MSARDAIAFKISDSQPTHRRTYWFDHLAPTEEPYQEEAVELVHTDIADMLEWWETSLGAAVSKAFLAKRSRVDVPSEDDRLDSKFQSLKTKWAEDTMFLSSVADKVLNSNYQKIIGMGPSVVPLLLADLSSEDGDWFWALEHITAANPVPQHEWGDRPRMIERWLQWAKKEGIV